MRFLGLGLVGVLALLTAGVVWAGNYIYGLNLYVDPACHDSRPFSPDNAKLVISSNPLSHRIDPTVVLRMKGSVITRPMRSPSRFGRRSWNSPTSLCR